MKYMRSMCICNTFETIHDNGRHCGVAFDEIYLQWWFYYDIHRVRSSMFWILNTEFISITIQTKMILFFFFFLFCSTDICCVSCFNWATGCRFGQRLFKSSYCKSTGNANFNTWKLYLIHNFGSRSELGS